MTNAEEFKELYRKNITREGAPELLKWLESTDFFSAPASTKYHGAYPGGLVDHSLNVYFAFYAPLDAVKILNFEALLNLKREEFSETVTICTLLHDICKANYYEPLDGGGYRVHNRFPFGHGEKSVFLISRFMRLTDAEALAIRWHMGAYDDAARGGSRELSAAMSATPLVYELHAADMRATQREQREESGEPV